MTKRNLVICLAAMGLGAGLVRVAPAESVRRIDGREIEGAKIKWFESRREYQIENADGSFVAIPVDEVASVQVARPAEYDKALQAFKAKQYDVAIPILNDLVTRYRRLQWDDKARELLVNVSFAKGDYKQVVQMLGEAMANTPKRLIPDDQRVMYWTALAGAQMTASLKKELNEAIAGDSKPLAARAMIQRGDLFKAEGKRDDAVLDYMRAVIQYEDAPEARAEALFKAAGVLTEMRDPRGDELKKKVLQMYPASPYAKRLAGQM